MACAIRPFFMLVADYRDPLQTPKTKTATSCDVAVPEWAP
jgi:hypothetical protein